MVMVLRLRERRRIIGRLLPRARDPEPYRWRLTHLNRRVAYWTRRVIKKQVQLQEVSGHEYPDAYLRCLRAAREVGLPQKADAHRGPQRDHPDLAQARDQRDSPG